MNRKARLVVGGSAVVVLVAGIVTAVASHEAPANHDRRDGSDLILGAGADHLPNITASDWVTYADHVVAVTATDEVEVPPAKEEVDRGEGLILRDVTLRVDDVVWSRKGAEMPAPKTFRWTALGWQFTDGSLGNRTKMGSEGRPRIETGHHYLIAIEWEDAKCSEGDEPEPAQWRGLGSGAIVPYDAGVIGAGEMEGAITTPDEAVQHAKSPSNPDFGVADKVAGRDARALAVELDAAKPVAKQQFGPDPSTTRCAT